MTDSALQFRVDTEGVEKVIGNMPKVAYFHMRAFVFGSMLDHRLAWLKRKGTKFGRGQKGIKVKRVGDTTGQTDRTVVYDVPMEKRARSALDAVSKLRRFDASIHTGNLVLPVHQFGTDVKAKNGYMAIPLKRTKPGNIRDWKAANNNRRLVVRPMRNGNLLAFEVNVKNARGKGPSPIGPGRVRVKWTPRFVLARKVDMQPTLEFYETWDALAAQRREKFARRSSQMLADFDKRDPRDL